MDFNSDDREPWKKFKDSDMVRFESWKGNPWVESGRSVNGQL